MNNLCPCCGSDDFQSFRMAYESGTAYAVSRPVLDVGGRESRTVVQSLIAQRVAPPKKKKVHWALWLFGLLSLLCAISLPFLIVIPIVGAIGVFLWIRRYNRTTWISLQQKWERSWICFRCGHAFEK
ncbi:MAG TPA: hypothetical protein VK717_01795 [Opitutaceae bacterium]|jgi:hypothetical protein|nr:hypothetical protein [Opitutaceae bacterium]